MSYLEFFHFDKEPFSTTSFNNYLYENKGQFKVINTIVNSIRFYSGIYPIIGGEGVGKTFVLKQIQNILSNNDIVIFINASEKTDILKVISEQISMENKKQNIDNVFQSISKYHKKGQNIILIIDNFEELNKEQIINLSSLIEVIDYLKVIVAGNKNVKKVLNSKKYIFRTKIVKYFKLSHFSVIKGMKYINSISINALSLSQYKNVITFWPRFFISFISNRNIKNLNYITNQVIKNAFQNQNHKVKLKDVYSVAKKNFDLVKENIYIKFQKVFVWGLILLSLYYCFKLVGDRYDLLKTIEVKKSIDKQEKEFEKLY